MTTLYADTSALATAYLRHEPEHGRFRELLLEAGRSVVTSTLTRVELASTVRTVASRRPRVRQAILEQFDVDCKDGPLTLVAFAGRVFGRAYEIVLDQPVRTLDALHLAVALDVLDKEPDLVFVTRDARQAAAARSLGLAVG